MQIPQRKKTKLFDDLRPVILFSIIGIFIAIIYINWHKKSDQNIVWKKVHMADFTEEINVFGSLVAAEKRGVNTQVPGVINEIYYKSGDDVTKNSIILTLDNPRIIQEYEDAQLNVLVAQAALEETVAELLRERWQLEKEEKITKGELSIANAELAAKKKLFSLSIVSQLEYAKAILYVEQSSLKWELAKKDLESFHHIEKLKIQSSKINLEKIKRFEVSAMLKVDALNIKASMSGLIQEFYENVKLGGWLNSGTAIGVIANVSNMIAEMSMPASFASNASIGDVVSLNIKGQVVKAKITRIEQTVKNNQIRFDVKLFESLPKTARANIEVKGRLSVSYGSNILLIEGLYGISSGVRKLLYRPKQNENEKYHYKDIKIGLVRGEFIEILMGAEEGDYIGIIRKKDGK